MSHLILKNVGLTYPIYGANSHSFKRGIINIATGGRLDKNNGKIEVEALTDINLSLSSGDRLGLIGHNGAGKTTLLKVLSGVYEPSAGKIDIDGHSSCLFDIMLGFDRDSTGIENIILRGLIVGLTHREVRKLIPDIEAFAELGDFINMPIRTYSSGMLVRLAFGIITSLPADILLLDEVVNVGDANFMAKAKDRLHNLIHRSDILVLSTHEVPIMREFCNKGLWLEHGTVKAFGDLEAVLDQYLSKTHEHRR